MADDVAIPVDWTDTERWVWGAIEAGYIADLNTRDRAKDPDFKNLDPTKPDGWGDNRRLRAGFLQTILTKKEFIEATPFSGVRISGALVDDAPLDLNHARLTGQFWLERSRVLKDVYGFALRIDGGLSLERSFVGGGVRLNSAYIREGLYMEGATVEAAVTLNLATVDRSVFLGNGAMFKGEVDLVGIYIGSSLNMTQSIFEECVNLNTATVHGPMFLSRGATFRGELDIAAAHIGANLEMAGSTFEKRVTLNRATVGGLVLLRDGATFKGEVDFVAAKIGPNLEMDRSIFEGHVNLISARIGASLGMTGSTFTDEISLERVIINGGAFLRDNAIFKGAVGFLGVSIGSDLDLSDAQFEGEVNLTGCRVTHELRLGSSGHPPARWAGKSRLVLRNVHVGALQDWWQDDASNSWPKEVDLEGFAYDRLGGLRGEGDEADMAARPSAAYVKWLARDWTFSPQPYEQLARVFRQAGEPGKANHILYAGRERRRREALKRRQWGLAAGLWLLRATIGYGLGYRYFRALGWVAGFTLLGMGFLHFGHRPSPHGWLGLFFASFDQLVPIITLNKAHDALVFGDAALHPPIPPPPYLVAVNFYIHKIVGWVLGSFIVAGLAGLTQRN